MRPVFRYVIGALVAGVALLVSCTPGSHIDSGPQRPDPSEPTRGPVLASAQAGKTTFVLHDEGEGCLAVDIQHPGLQPTVEQACFGKNAMPLRTTSTCGWLAEPPAEQSWNCDLKLSSVIYGQISDPDVGYVCVGTFGESGGSAGVTGARALPMDDDGYVFVVAQPNERPPAHFLSRGGSRIGDPPLDAPSGPIYKLCEAQASAERRENVYHVDLAVTFDEELRSDDVTIFFHSGLDRIGLSGAANDGGAAALLSVRVTPEVSRFMVDVEVDGEPILAGLQLEWPDEVQDLLFSDETCNALTTVGIYVGPAVLDGSVEEPIDVSFVGSDCPLGDR